YDLMRTLQQGAQPQPSPPLQLQGAPVLAPVMPGPNPGRGPLWNPTQPNAVPSTVAPRAPAAPAKP
ncbi:MAG: hypothetical protein EBU07_18970, partial [Betaproteobacteria bacterium]|nr:hypothetical protein [Betaproteobacteria bacterium]